jgi:hypothetical protein
MTVHRLDPLLARHGLRSPRTLHGGIVGACTDVRKIQGGFRAWFMLEGTPIPEPAHTRDGGRTWVSELLPPKT